MGSQTDVGLGGLEIPAQTRLNSGLALPPAVRQRRQAGIVMLRARPLFPAPLPARRPRAFRSPILAPPRSALDYRLETHPLPGSRRGIRPGAAFSHDGPFVNSGGVRVSASGISYPGAARVAAGSAP